MGSPQSVLDPAPAETEVAENKLAVFSNLPSVVAARKSANSLNISYDCEYQSVDKDGNPDPAGEYRIILSYQFALYLNENEILEVCFITRNPSISNRLGYRNFVGAILDLLRDEFNYDYLSIAYSSTKKEVVSEKRHIFEGSEETYTKFYLTIYALSLVRSSLPSAPINLVRFTPAGILIVTGAPSIA